LAESLNSSLAVAIPDFSIYSKAPIRITKLALYLALLNRQFYINKCVLVKNMWTLSIHWKKQPSSMCLCTQY